ncbi:MAG: hypothetical protein EXR83_15375 [Gammaproteobacteria bacterium]|nr:hypothetical protein [Gammaproteobacteria bacterium]
MPIVGRLFQAIGGCATVVAARSVVRDRYAPAAGALVLARASSLLAWVPLLGPMLGAIATCGWAGGRRLPSTHCWGPGLGSSAGAG